ncbi:uncharacterized protein PHACADRAFT_211204 [Phanerochaete carnosa HHB-10118-sp]|uniref:Protein kinase domain-containing protein n=1 Tax=Phanerochaete carnosa (strain HHB-10118-sp) TaxID=650164 RepID=K5W3L3_PHACS|nr:uncharacterized protein PHACADRAFT_211204 [Phanerochaete carnosa HHB-10118-sp]EKM53514.1 hypothetical protein PHACADRAFT_211204 [Phanerochaete carnosa HHB-10118-sp]
MATLAFNAIATVTLTGLFPTRKNPQAGSLTTQLQRREVPLNLLKPAIRDPSTCKGNGFVDMPPRPPSKQPPPGNAHLHASLGEYLGHGHSSIVFDLRDVQLSSAPSDVVVPPLVVKVARINRVTSLLREAWFYDDMECIQGVSIPRCYGYFETEVPEDSDVRRQLLAVAKKYRPEDDGEENLVLSRDQMMGPLHPLLAERCQRRDIIAVTILEKLGPQLPLGQELSEETKEDLESMFEDMAHLCINNVEDIRWENILQAPDTSSSLPSLPSPFTQKVHRWRAIDFELAIKINLSVPHCQLEHYCGLGGVYDHVESWYEEEYSWPEEESESDEDWLESRD